MRKKILQNFCALGKAFAFGALMFLGIGLNAQYVWNGSSSSDFMDANNWDGGTVPVTNYDKLQFGTLAQGASVCVYPSARANKFYTLEFTGGGELQVDAYVYADYLNWSSAGGDHLVINNGGYVNARHTVYMTHGEITLMSGGGLEIKSPYPFDFGRGAGGDAVFNLYGGETAIFKTHRGFNGGGGTINCKGGGVAYFAQNFISDNASVLTINAESGSVLTWEDDVTNSQEILSSVDLNFPSKVEVAFTGSYDLEDLFDKFATGRTSAKSSITIVQTPAAATNYTSAQDISVQVDFTDHFGNQTSKTVTVSLVNEWTGATDTDWATAGNWTMNAVPTSAHNVSIPDVANDPVIPGDAAVNNITVASGAVLTVNSGASLAIMGSASGNATIKRNTTGSKGYSVVGAPVSGKLVDELAANYVYDYIETSGTWSSNLSASTNAMTPGKGYFVAYDASTPQVNLSGALVSGDQSVAVTSGGTDTGSGSSWNIVANPYAAAISSDDVIANATNASNTTGSLYIWNDGGANNGALRAGSYVIANNSNSMDIGSAQGFFVQATGTSMDFTPSMQVTTAGANADGNYYRKASADQKLKLTLTGNDLYNEVVVALDENATEGVDYGWDAAFLAGNEFMSFYTFLDGNKFATQGLPVVDAEEVSIELGMDLKESGSYAITAAEFEGFEGLTALLVDNVTGKTYELGKNVEVPFTTDAVSASKRFSVVFAPARVLGSSILNNNLQVLGGIGELKINFNSNNNENVSIYALDGRVMYSNTVKFNSNKAVINPTLVRNQVYVLRVNNESVKFILK